MARGTRPIQRHSDAPHPLPCSTPFPLICKSTSLYPSQAAARRPSPPRLNRRLTACRSAQAGAPHGSEPVKYHLKASLNPGRRAWRRGRLALRHMPGQSPHRRSRLFRPRHHRHGHQWLLQEMFGGRRPSRRLPCLLRVRPPRRGVRVLIHRPPQVLLLRRCTRQPRHLGHVWHNQTRRRLLAQVGLYPPLTSLRNLLQLVLTQALQHQLLRLCRAAPQ